MGHSQVNLRRTHPLLFHGVLTAGLFDILLALNYWRYTPTFSPYGIHKNIPVVVFLVIGAAVLAFLVGPLRDLPRMRLSLAFSGWLTLFWGISNTQQVFQHKASFALPLCLTFIAVMEGLLLIEAPVNPMTEKGPSQ